MAKLPSQNPLARRLRSAAKEGEDRRAAAAAAALQRGAIERGNREQARETKDMQTMDKPKKYAKGGKCGKKFNDGGVAATPARPGFGGRGLSPEALQRVQALRGSGGQQFRGMADAARQKFQNFMSGAKPRIAPQGAASSATGRPIVEAPQVMRNLPPDASGAVRPSAPPAAMARPSTPATMAKGGKTKKYAKGGKIDGCATKGKTHTKMVKMAKGGKIDGIAKKGRTKGKMR